MVFRENCADDDIMAKYASLRVFFYGNFGNLHLRYCGGMISGEVSADFWIYGFIGLGFLCSGLDIFILIVIYN